MWAAYIDLDYAGGKIGEYQFYDRAEQRWDTTSCQAHNGRCAKMDCHLPSTHFSLLGFFKEPNYHEWMEQLFKHRTLFSWGCGQHIIFLTLFFFSLLLAGFERGCLSVCTVTVNALDADEI